VDTVRSLRTVQLTVNVRQVMKSANREVARCRVVQYRSVLIVMVVNNPAPLGRDRYDNAPRKCELVQNFWRYWILVAVKVGMMSV
jgi:hypothetical protein